MQKLQGRFSFGRRKKNHGKKTTALNLWKGACTWLRTHPGESHRLLDDPGCGRCSSGGRVINVDTGTYPELVSVGKTLTIRGAQAGVDARSNTRSVNESVTTGAAGSSSFYIAANDVTIDGFTVQGNTSQTNYGTGHRHGARHPRHPDPQQHSAKQCLRPVPLQQQHNRPGPHPIQRLPQQQQRRHQRRPRHLHRRIFFGGKLTNVTIDANSFYKNLGSSGTTGLEAAIAIEPYTAGITSNIRVTNNSWITTAKPSSSFTPRADDSGNCITNTQDKYSGTLRFEGDDQNVTIQGNTLYDNTGPAVALDSKGVPGDNSGFVVNNNNFYGNSTGYGAQDLPSSSTTATTPAPLDARTTGGAIPPAPAATGRAAATASGATATSSPDSSGPPRRAERTFSPWSTAPIGSREHPTMGAPLPPDL